MTSDRSALAVAVEELGSDVASDKGAFIALLPELIGGSGRPVGIRTGLALGAKLRALRGRPWRGQVALTENPNIQVLCGFLNGLQSRNSMETQAFLDEAINDAVARRNGCQSFRPASPIY